MTAKFSGALPKDSRNGLGMLSAAMTTNPEAVHVVIALVDCSKITTDVDTGDIIPTARIRAIEGFIAGTADAKEVRRLWRRAYERRNGQVELPLELERALDELVPEDERDDAESPPADGPDV
jgi:hypothetical protein